MIEIELAADAIRRGELVIMPTETVYGLAADASNSDAIARVYALKRRPSSNPLIVHIESTARLQAVARDVPPMAWTLIERFWPGPLTLVLPKGGAIASAATAGGETVAVRMPNHPLALALIAESDRPLAAPSANLSERLSPTRIEDVAPEIAAGAAAVLDGGACRIGIESTVVDATGPSPSILRLGSVTGEMIERALGCSLTAPKMEGPMRSPGMMSRHYSPRARVRIVHAGPADIPLAAESPDAFAAALYARLAVFDAQGLSTIRVEDPPDGPEWAAVRDRLRRMGAYENA